MTLWCIATDQNQKLVELDEQRHRWLPIMNPIWGIWSSSRAELASRCSSSQSQTWVTCQGSKAYSSKNTFSHLCCLGFQRLPWNTRSRISCYGEMVDLLQLVCFNFPTASLRHVSSPPPSHFQFLSWETGRKIFYQANPQEIKSISLEDSGPLDMCKRTIDSCIEWRSWTICY